ncbi:hypothetical protein CEE69_01465 [Rhodopirellula bahusiensis]|uniref:Uncharacterized protein n=1 Tax=Rhodopirellula bahusiensis TaxID=2014065 RepID=A0A2G1WDG6_9BACT|nr:hypothetical protein CEE69_01465 [Rhodopirellula bahusiensis]
MQRIKHRTTQPEPILSSRIGVGNSRATSLQPRHFLGTESIASADSDAGMPLASVSNLERGGPSPRRIPN